MTILLFLSVVLCISGLVALMSWVTVRHSDNAAAIARVSNVGDLILYATGVVVSGYGLASHDAFAISFAATLLALLFVVLLIRWIGRRYAYAPPVRADEIHFARTNDLWQLRLCRYKPKHAKTGEPVILCHGLASNHYFFTLPEGDSLVDVLTEHGYDCWVVELRGARSSIPAFGRNLNQPTIDDHLLQDLPGILRCVQEATGFPRIHWIGHSLGGMLGYAHALLTNNEGMATLTIIGSPLSLKGRVLRVAAVPILTRLLSRQGCRALFYVVVRIASVFKLRTKYSMIDWRNLHPRIKPSQVYDVLEAPPLRVLLNLSRSVGRRKWLVRNETVDMFDLVPELSLPVMGVYGTADSVARADHMAPRFDLIQSNDKRLLVVGKTYGHYADYDHADLLLGRASREDICEPIAEWLEAHPLIDTKILSAAKVLEGVKTPPKRVPKKSAATTKAAVSSSRRKVADPTPNEMPVKKAPARKKPVAASTAKPKTTVKAKPKAKPKAKLKTNPKAK